MNRMCLFVALCALNLQGSDFDVLVSEIHYNPLGSDDRGEFLELFNRGPTRVDLSGWYFEAGVDFTFPAGAVLDPGRRLVVAGDPAFLAAQGVADVYGPWAGRLDNDGELIILNRADGMQIDLVSYGDGGLWPSLPDGNGPSLELGDPNADNELAEAWHASAVVGGTPGCENGPPAPPSAVRINEIGTAPGAGWVELFNTGGAPVALGGCTVARANVPGARTVLPETVIADRAVFPLTFEVRPGTDRYLLLGPDGATLLDCIELRLPPGTESSGRFPDGDDEVYAFATASLGLPNASPVNDDVYISEIMYRPMSIGSPPVEPLGLEYIGIANRGTFAVDLTGWRFTRGVDFTFPEGVVLMPGAELIVASNVEMLQAAHPGLSDVIGQWTGKLRNSAEKIVLRDARGNLINRVRYADDGPWPREADGGDAALCLKTSHRAIDNGYGQAWEAVPGGTPGIPPSDAAVAPLVVDVAHDPPVPRSSDRVAVTCRVMDSDAVTSVTLQYRIDGGGSYSIAMRDDGTGPDAVPGDGRWAAEIGPFAAGAVVAFHIVAVDATARTTDAPGAGKDFLFACDNAAPPANGSRHCRIICTQATWNLLNADIWSNELRDATLIGAEKEVRYNVGIRFRGSSSRRLNPKSYRVNVPNADPYLGFKRINLNCLNMQSQLLATDFFRRAGLPCSLGWAVNFWMRGAWNQRYIWLEAVDKEFLTRCFGGANDGGILYRGWESDELYRSAGFTYYGEDPESYRPLYENVTGDWDHDDYREVIALCKVFAPEFTSDADFAAAVEAKVDVRQWLLFFAAQACISNNEAGISTDRGDDFFFYLRPNDGRAVLIPWDFDSCFSSATERLFRPTVAAINRFLTHPAFAPRFYEELEKLATGPFSHLENRRRGGLIAGMYPAATWDGIESFMTRRLGYIRDCIPTALRGGIAEIGEPMLIAQGDLWRYFKGTENPSGGDLSWTALDFDDSEWLEGPSGFGYEDLDDATVLDDMRGRYSTPFIRRKFTVANPATITSLTLRMDWDDGFVAYLNGQLVASRVAPSGIPQYTWQATGHHEAGIPENINISGSLGHLRAGDNVLAIVGLNYGIESTDFSLIPELVLPRQPVVAGGCGGPAYAAAAEARIAVELPASRTRRLEVNGIEQDYDPVRAQWDGVIPLEPGENLVDVRAYDIEGDLIEATELTVVRVPGLTTLTGTLPASRTLTAAGGPYLLAGTLTVPAGRTLTVEPGVTILADGNASMLIDGLIVAAGTDSAPILFTGLSCSRLWNGIGIRNTGAGAGAPVHTFAHCIFRAGNRRGDFGGLLGARNARLSVVACRFERNAAPAIDAVDGEIEVLDCRFENGADAVRGTRSIAVIGSCEFLGLRGESSAIRLAGDGARASLVEECVVRGSNDDGIVLSQATCAVNATALYGCEDNGVVITGAGALGASALNGVIITAGGTGLRLAGEAAAEAEHATIAGNQEGIAALPGAGGGLQGCIVWQNMRDVAADPSAALAVAFSNVGGAAAWPGQGNLCVDPLFFAPEAADFSLRPESVCIGTAHDGKDMGAVPYEGPSPVFVRGDANGDGAVGLADALYILAYLFTRDVTPACLDALDTNDSGLITLADAVYILGYIFRGGPPPPPPFDTPGRDRTPDGLTCGA